MEYVGQELELFTEARNWKSYWSSMVQPYLRGRVLEVGAGLGATTTVLCTSDMEWTCMEPDPRLARHIGERIARGDLPRTCRVHQGVMTDLPPDERFDTILYIDVLEHIANDGDEVIEATKRLSTTGHLVVLAPAHDWLFSPFDQEIGHCRRYSRATLEQLAGRSLSLVQSRYVDSLGLLLSLGNRWLLRRELPTTRNIMFWDRRVVPWSRLLDGWLRFCVGKTVICVWRQTA
jgi:SAM-dependent methyltransferase